eukprot:TRINITY_DN18943_c0_g1_i1.p1 TRINITY_DN18943_c0_g1~~TRINITY_DN18943_c0_g1_i1.p1  ORF type:complete len:675 (-),score=171.81 TRINITY_DN18943_c0_g1_i1:102-2126(-)
MAEPDSWEDMDEGPAPPKPSVAKTKLNPNAAAFSFNPGARAFVPGGASSAYAPTGLQAPTANFRPPAAVQSGIQQTGVRGSAPVQISGGSSAGNNSIKPVSHQPQSQKVEPVPQATSASASTSGSHTVAGSSVSITTPSQIQGEVQVTPVEAAVDISENLDGDMMEEDTQKVEDIQTAAGDMSASSAAGVEELQEKIAGMEVDKGEFADGDDDEQEEADFEGRNQPGEPIDDEKDDRMHLNIVFIGHVDAGKSTIGGQILYLTGAVDERTKQKYEREAKDKNRESWYMAYIMDTNEEERAKGKTVEVGRAHFETELKRYTILDAPGHKNYVPNMISGASQADVGVLVIAARKGEFETGFERGGQTREHAQLAKTLGVSKLLVVVNKMDDPSVNWEKERFDEIVTKMTPFLKSCGYNVKKDVQFLPISGLFGLNMKDRMGKEVCPWFEGPCLFEALDMMDPPERDPNAPFRMPLIDKYRDMGTVVMGKIESGSIRVGDSLWVMPNKAKVKVLTLMRDTDEVAVARPGENLRIRLQGIEEDDISAGFVLSSISRPIRSVVEFEAWLHILELLDHKAIFTAGYKAILHIHSVVEECEIVELKEQMDLKTKKKMKKKVLFVKSGALVLVRIMVNEAICVEKFEDFPQLGRFTLRDEGKTVALGKVTGFPSGEPPASAE